MGTLHSDRGALHGITVVVDTHGPQIWIGRCDTANDDGVVLLDGDTHEEKAEGQTKAEWVRRAAEVGIWKHFDRATVPMEEVATIRRLSDVR